MLTGWDGSRVRPPRRGEEDLGTAGPRPGRHPGTTPFPRCQPGSGGTATPAPWLCPPPSTERPPGWWPPRCCREAGAGQTARTLPSSLLRRARENGHALAGRRGELGARGSPASPGLAALTSVVNGSGLWGSGRGVRGKGGDGIGGGVEPGRGAPAGEMREVGRPALGVNLGPCVGEKGVGAVALGPGLGQKGRGRGRGRAAAAFDRHLIFSSLYPDPLTNHAWCLSRAFFFFFFWQLGSLHNEGEAFVPPRFIGCDPNTYFPPFVVDFREHFKKFRAQTLTRSF